MKNEIRVVLSAEDFSLLVAGQEVLYKGTNPKEPPVRLILSDIGFDVMHSVIDRAEGCV